MKTKSKKDSIGYQIGNKTVAIWTTSLMFGPFEVPAGTNIDQYAMRKYGKKINKWANNLIKKVEQAHKATAKSKQVFKMLDIQEMTQRFRASKQTIRRWVKESGLPATKSKGRLLFDKAKVDKWDRDLEERIRSLIRSIR